MRLLVFLAFAALLAACATGPRERYFPPAASVQEIRVGEDGRWTVEVRLQNTARRFVRLNGIEASLKVGGVEAAQLQRTFDLTIAANGAERLSFEITPSTLAASTLALALADGRAIDYQITGRSSVIEPRKVRDPFEFASRLSPAPGLPGTLR